MGMKEKTNNAKGSESRPGIRLSGTRWALRPENAEILASSSYGDPLFKPDGEVTHSNNVTRRADGIAVIHVDGALSYRSDFMKAWYGMDTYESIGNAFDECLADDSVKGILFDINSPGGEVGGVADLAAKIFAARGRKPCGINARTGGMMCSAAYWLASACEKIACADNAEIGSIGVLCTFSKLDSEFSTTVVSNLSTNKCPSPEEPEGLAVIKKELDDLASVFIDSVAKYRGTDYQTVLTEYGQGGVFIGQKAVNAGLADEVVSMEDLIREMVSGKQEGAQMADPKNGAEAKPQGVNVDEIRAQAATAERARISAINEAFAGLSIDEKDVKAFVDGGKSVAEAEKFALSAAKKAIESAKASAKHSDPQAGLSAEQKALLAKGMAADTAQAGSVQSGASDVGENAERKAFMNGFKKAYSKFKETK